MTGDSDIAVEEGGQLGLGQGADLGGFYIAVLEQHQCGNTAYAILRWSIGILIDVQLADLEFAFVIPGDIVQDRGNHLARTTPFSPIINQNGAVGLQHFGFEAAVGDVHDQITHEFLQERFARCNAKDDSITPRNCETRGRSAITAVSSQYADMAAIGR